LIIKKAGEGLKAKDARLFTLNLSPALKVFFSFPRAAWEPIQDALRPEMLQQQLRLYATQRADTAFPHSAWERDNK